MTEARSIRVVLVDDQVLVRTGFAALLAAENDIDVVGQGDDGEEGIALVEELQPDVVLMDIRMPGTDGLEASRVILRNPALPDVKILVLTTFELDEYVYEALSIGASGFLVKHTDPTELIRAVRVVADGDALLSPSVTKRLIANFTGNRARTPDAPTNRLTELLTEREREAVSLVAEGASNTEIAERWFVSEATVRTHVSRAMTKLHARDRAQLVVMTYQHGLGRILPPKHLT